MSSFPSGFWPEFIVDDSSITNLIDSTFEDDTTSTTAVSFVTARDDLDAVVSEKLEEETADEDTTAANAETSLAAQDSSSSTAVPLDAGRDDESDSTVEENLGEETADDATTVATADEATTVATAETTLAEQDSSSTTVDSTTKWNTTTFIADITSEHQNSTLHPPSKQPPTDKPKKKNWADIFCDKVEQFLSFMGHKITDTVSFIQRLFHWLN